MKKLYEVIFNESIFDDDSIINDANKQFILDFLDENYTIIDRTNIIGKGRKSRRDISLESLKLVSIDNNIVNIHGSILCKNYKIKSLTNGLFKFGIIDGDFTCNGCELLKSLAGAPEKVNAFECCRCFSLKSLEGAPKEAKYFSCSDCKGLKSLAGAPENVDGIFDCSYCESLKSLINGPKFVKDAYYCYRCNSLKSLEGIATGFKKPIIISCSDCTALKSLNGLQGLIGEFNCSYCESLKSLKGLPEKIDGEFNCSWCRLLTSLEGGPELVNGDYKCQNCENLKSLNGVAKEIKGSFWCNGSNKLKESDILKVNARNVYYIKK